MSDQLLPLVSISYRGMSIGTSTVFNLFLDRSRDRKRLMFSDAHLPDTKFSEAEAERLSTASTRRAHPGLDFLTISHPSRNSPITENVLGNGRPKISSASAVSRRAIRIIFLRSDPAGESIGSTRSDVTQRRSCKNRATCK